MIPSIVAEAAINRIKADTTLYSGAWTSALAGGASWHRGNDQLFVFPFVVVSVQFPEASPFFEGMGAVFTMTMEIYDQHLQSSGLGRITTITERLIGDAMLSSGNRSAPTYGFYNHRLSLGTNALNLVCDQIDMDSSSLGWAEDIAANVQTLVFRGRVSNQAVNV